MPGQSFLFKKSWHPSSKANEKRVFIAEQEASRQINREKEAQDEIQKGFVIPQDDATQQSDPRSTELRFMYSLPELSKLNERSLSSTSVGDDEYVSRFKDNVMKSQYPDRVVDSSSKSSDRNYSPQKKYDRCNSTDESNISAAPLSALEGSLGRKRPLICSQSELKDRHPRLKNAPVKGAYTKNLQLKHKPFAEPVRNVRCVRCGVWGHQSGDRECAMLGSNPLDNERLQREDPLMHMRAGVIKDSRNSTEYELIPDDDGKWTVCV
jgi:N-terminal domain of CBF1 interacting co-repressor CIR